MRYVPARDGARAGLAAVQNDRSLLLFGVTQAAGKPVVALWTRAGADRDTLVATAPIDPRKPVALTIRADGGTMAFDYANGGKGMTLKNGVDVRFLSTKDAGGFVGTVIGPFDEP